MDKMLTYGEVAARLSVSVRTVKRMVADGRLTAVRVGPRSPRIPESAMTVDLAEERSA